MVKRKTQLTIKVSRSRKKNLRLGRQNKTPLISQPCIKCPGLLDVIASPIIKLKKKQRTSPIKLTHRKRTFGSRSPGSPFCKGTPHRRQNFRPTPSKSLESPYHLVAVSGAHFTQGTILIVIIVSSGSAKSRTHQSAVGGFLVTRRGWPGRLRACRIWTFINSV